MAERKRNAKSSLQAQLNTMRSVSEILASPIPLSEREQTIFDDVVSARESESWSRADLLVASQLAKNMRRQEELGDELDRIGYTQVNEKGTTISNPIFSALMQIANSIQAQMRTLGLSASQRGLANAEQKSRNKADASARKLIENAQDGLLA